MYKNCNRNELDKQPTKKGTSELIHDKNKTNKQIEKQTQWENIRNNKPRLV